tara:strand:- start:45 stop:272 length:228 start_codon:yes stop_codon:yes gene_type:complete
MSKVRKKDTQELLYWDFNKINYIIFAVGILVIVSGYVLMASGETDSFQSTKLAPIVLTIGYIVIIPCSILCKFKK